MKTIKKITVLVLAGMLLLVMNQPVLAVTEKVNINTASKKELVTLKYVGDAIADRIIEHRKAAPFQKPEDIMKVKGIGEKVFEVNKDNIVVQD